MEVTVKDRQTLLDIQIIACGSLEGIIRTCALNNISVTESLTDGQVLQVAEIIQASVAKTYANRGFSPATNIESDANVKVGGIGFMAVEMNFVVS